MTKTLQATRRQLLTGVSAMCTLVSTDALLNSSRVFGQTGSNKRVATLGGHGGNELTLEYVDLIGWSWGNSIDGIDLNGRHYAGHNSNNAVNSIALTQDDYWTDVEIHHGKYIDYISLKSRNGTMINGGNRHSS